MSNHNQQEPDKDFINMVDLFIEHANQQTDKADHQMVNAAMLYATARFSAFITASLSESKESYEGKIDEAVGFYGEQFKKMLEEHMEQYKTTFDKETLN